MSYNWFLGLYILLSELYFLPTAPIQFLESFVCNVRFHPKEGDLALMSPGSQGLCAGEMSKWAEHWLCIMLTTPHSLLGPRFQAMVGRLGWCQSVVGPVGWCTELVCSS